MEGIRGGVKQPSVKEHSQVSACVVDTSGLFLPLARRLAEPGGFKRVLYHTPSWNKGSPELNEAIIGMGFDELEWCDDIWESKADIDLFVFPDLNHSGMQLELRSQGYAVWGAGGAMKLETNREFFLEQLKELGLDVPPHDKVVGITALGEYLKDKEDIFIKLSRWRKTWETKHFRNWQLDGHKLPLWAVKFGGVREYIPFLCFHKIETQLEIGGDTFVVDGQWAQTQLHGIEKKDEAYFAAVTPRDKMPEELTHIMDAFSPYLAQTQARTQWSMEVRVAESGVYFIDATLRGGLPSTGSQLVAVKNFPELLWHGAHGELLVPEYRYKFTAECAVRIKGDAGSWETLIIPRELKPYLKVCDCCQVDDQIWIPADDEPTEEIGWLVSAGDTPTECAKQMNELADQLPEGAEAAVESLADIIREIEAEEEQGIPFTDQPLPDPEIVLEPT